MKTLRLILGDQLSESISSLKDCSLETDVILMCEVWDEATYVKHHKKKIAFLFSAMRHFAQLLQKKGVRVEHSTLENPDNTGSFTSEVKRILAKQSFDKVVVTHPSEHRVYENILKLKSELNIPVLVLEDDRFLSQHEQFSAWAKNRKQLRMEYFYRDIRKQYNILMDGSQPVGGKWNYDTDNRKPHKEGLTIPSPYQVELDAITTEVISLVSKRFDNHFGDLTPFFFAVTRTDALKVLDHFMEHRLPYFGDYQDAMVQDEPWMYHAHISFYLNCGLLLPLECVRAAEKFYDTGKAPLNAVEGFIRQIIGWREYVRGIYWLKMPEYSEQNFFNAQRSLPEFYWTANTNMNCLSQCIQETKRNAYAHHIQRLMVLGNFALLAGIQPKEVNEWFLIVYADAYEWVELPNVSGMTLFADGGYLASKPYAAGGNYIKKMSNYCQNCTYSVSKKTGPDACPFNYLYWDFLDRNREKLSKNQRLSMIYKTFERMDQGKQKAIRDDSQKFLDTL